MNASDDDFTDSDDNDSEDDNSLLEAEQAVEVRAHLKTSTDPEKAGSTQSTLTKYEQWKRDPDFKQFVADILAENASVNQKEEVTSSGKRDDNCVPNSKMPITRTVVSVN